MVCTFGLVLVLMALVRPLLRRNGVRGLPGATTAPATRSR
jgi:hypothetical protein